MNRPWLILDCQNVLYRSHYAMGGLAHDGFSTGAVFGFFKEVFRLQSQFQTDRVAFCFDHGREPIRRKAYPEYKMNRNKKERTEEEKESLRELQNQSSLLRTQWLPELEHPNVFFWKGYEADDVIASVCRSLDPGDDAVLVSSDRDLFQLLSHRVRQWLPGRKELYDTKRLGKEFFGVEPGQWANVKAVAGCSTDNVAGVPGVGEITAAKWLRGVVQEGSRIDRKIREHEAVWKRNLPLVRAALRGDARFRPAGRVI